MGLDIGIVRQIGPSGRLVIPKEIRKMAGIMGPADLEFIVDHSCVILRKIEVRCACCGKAENLVKFKKRYICEQCKKELGD